MLFIYVFTEPPYPTHSRKSDGDLHLPTPLLTRGINESVIKSMPTHHHHSYQSLYRPKEEPIDMPTSPGRGKSGNYHTFMYFDIWNFKASCLVIVMQY